MHKRGAKAYWALNGKMLATGECRFNQVETKENYMFGLGVTELVIILVIVIVLFGVGRLGRIGGELGSGIRAFREGLSGDKDEEAEEDKDGK